MAPSRTIEPISKGSRYSERKACPSLAVAGIWGRSWAGQFVVAATLPSRRSTTETTPKAVARPIARVRRADVLDAARQHDREEDQGQRAPDVDEDLHRGEKVGGKLHVEPRDAQEAPEQGDRRVDDVLRERHDAPRAEGQRGKNHEGNGREISGHGGRRVDRGAAAFKAVAARSKKRVRAAGRGGRRPWSAVGAGTGTGAGACPGRSRCGTCRRGSAGRGCVGLLGALPVHVHRVAEIGGRFVAARLALRRVVVGAGRPSPSCTRSKSGTRRRRSRSAR